MQQTERIGQLLRVCCAMLVLAPAATAAVGAQSSAGPYEIRLNLQQGRTYELATRVTSLVEQSLMGMDIKIGQDMSVTYRYRVVDVNRDGAMRLEVTYDSVVMAMDIDTPEIPAEQREAVNRELNESMLQTTKLLEGATFTVTAMPGGEIVSIEGTEELTERIFATLPNDQTGQQARDVIAGMISPETFNQSWQYMFSYLPSRPVSIGDSWERSFAMNQGMEMNATASYRLESVSDGELVISTEGTVVGGGLGGGPLAQFEAEGIAFELSMDGTQSGTMRVDAQTGWVVAQRLTMDASGEVALSIEGQSLQIPMLIEVDWTAN